MPKKTPSQIEEEHCKKLALQRKLIKESNVYRDEFEECLRRYLETIYPGHQVESLIKDPDERRSFSESWSPEAFDLCKKWNLSIPWDPAGEEIPEPLNDMALESEKAAGPEPVFTPPR